MRPFLLYHWSPVSRRPGILRHGLCPGKRSLKGDWRPPYVCFCRYPNTAWSLSASHHPPGSWDLWTVWSDTAAPYKTLNTGQKSPYLLWTTTEYRCFHRIPKSQVWLVGTRTHRKSRRAQPRNHRKPQ